MATVSLHTQSVLTAQSQTWGGSLLACSVANQVALNE